MKMHEHIGLFIYPSFNKYSLRRLYHMRLDCFNSYKNCCNLIEYMLRDFVQFALGNLNPSRIMYISLSMDSYKYVVITSMRRISSPSETAKLIKKQNVIAHDGRVCFLVVNTRSLQETLCYQSHFISYDLIILIAFSYKYPFLPNRLYIFRCLDYKSKNFSFC